MAYCGILPNLAMEEASEFNEINLPEPKRLQGCRYDPLPTLFYMIFSSEVLDLPNISQ